MVKSLLIIANKKLILPYMKSKNAKAYLFILPAVVLAFVFSYIPLFRSFISSFLVISSSGEVRSFAWLGNYISLFQDNAFLNSIGNTLEFMVLFVPLNAFLVLLASSLTRNSRHALPQFIFFSPAAVSLSAYALIFKEMFRGKVSAINRIFHTDIVWLESPGSAMLTLVFLGVFLDFGLDYILLLSAFRAIDRDIIDAAKLDGAQGLSILFRIELPIIKPMAAAVIAMSIKDALLISAPVMVLTEGGPFRSTETIMYYYYLEAFKSGNRAAESTIATLIVLLSVCTMAIVAKWRRHGWKNA